MALVSSASQISGLVNAASTPKDDVVALGVLAVDLRQEQFVPVIGTVNVAPPQLDGPVEALRAV